jgi:hypothetical protein
VGTTHYLQYTGLSSPVALHHAAELENLISTVIPTWPATLESTPPLTPPFATIRPTEKGKWAIDVHVGKGDRREWDAVDVVCDLISEIAWERLRSRPELLCLHAAAVSFGQRLVVFPNARRSGKSTLAIALARLGHELFTDDFLPVEVERHEATLLGIANGIAPRLRLPLPEDFATSFQAWVDNDPGPENDRYKYLLDIPLAKGLDTMPLGAVVVLKRQDDTIEPQLHPIGRSEALDRMIRQNFSRDMHSGRILKSIEVLTEHVPCFCLTYSSAESAAECLHLNTELARLPAARMNREFLFDDHRPAGQPQSPQTVFDNCSAYVQTSGLFETEVSGECFLADRQGKTIHRLNQGSVAIWQVLSEPTTLEELTEILSAAFPDVDGTRLRIDGENIMRQLSDAGLIEAAQFFAAEQKAPES